MTSSLVGSEMCIRDRYVCVLPAIAAPCVSCGRKCRPRMGKLLTRRAGAVSYTHLTLPTICSV
eukprot:3096677-Prorocentrum_lima.AAC.1